MALDTELLPWQQTQWLHLSKSLNAGQLPHALLLHGPQGVGKQKFAQSFAAYIMCQQKQADKACGQCKSCLLVQANSHPDLTDLQPEEPGKAIKVDRVRQLLHQFSQTAHHDGYKVVVIHPAEAMNRAAANALLKTLEEPGEQSLLILISDDASQLPATIRSRCQAVYFPPVPTEQAQTYLQQSSSSEQLMNLSHFCQGAPLQALDLADSDKWQQRLELLDGLVSIQQLQLDPVALAQSCYQYELAWLLQCLNKWMADVIRWQFSNQVDLYNNDYQSKIATIASQCSLYKCYQFLDKLNQAQQLVNSSINPNSQLLLEDLFGAWSQACKA